MSFVVISYCREDLPLVEKIADALLAKGHFAWYDKRIEQGDSWRLRIQGKIEESAATLVIWTKNSKDSKFVIDEARLAEKHGRLVQVLAGSAPALGFGEAHGFELDPNAEFNDKNLDWLKIVNEVTQRLKAMGWDTDVARERMDWGDWCQRKRQEVLRSLSSRAFERGIVFLYGDRAWNDAHLSALASSCAEQQVQEANPRPEEFARMLSFAEKLHKETDEFDSRFLGISAMMAATAYEFAQRAALTPKAGGTLSPVSLQNPSAFANVFFTRRVPFPDGPRSLLEMTTARGCVEFFLRFVQKIVDEEAGSETRYILIWPVSLIETLLLDANRVFDDQVKRVVADPASFAERFLVGVRDVVDAGAVPGRVGLVVRSQKFPCPKNYQVAKQCVLMMPPLDPAEMRDLILDTFGAQSEAWNFARITQLTGGLPAWMELFIQFQTHLTLVLGKELFINDVDRSATFLEMLMKDPRSYKQTDFDPLPAWLLAFRGELDAHVAAVRDDVTAAYSILRPREFTGAMMTPEWNVHLDNIIRSNWVALKTEEGGVGPSRLAPFHQSPRVSTERLPDLSRSAFDSVWSLAR